MSSAVIGSLFALAASGAWGVSDFLAGVRSRTTALPVVLLIPQFAGLVVLAAAVVGRSGDRSRLVLPGGSMVPAAVAGAAGAAALGLPLRGHGPDGAGRGRRGSPTSPTAATLTNHACAFALVSAWALGRWHDLAGPRRARPLTLLAVAAVGVADAIAELCFATASARAPLNVVTPLLSLYPAIAVLLALVVLHERLRPLAVAGVGCALLGVVLLA